MATDNKTEKKKNAETTGSDVKKKCFIITPIGDDNSEIRRKADGLIEAIIKPVLSELGYEPIVPHAMTKPGSITTQVIESILSVDMVIANLSGLNPNVMYELAVRHAIRKPVVCVVEKGTVIPFDISQDRVIFYSDEFFRVESLKNDLSQMIISAAEMNTDKIDNPIYRAQSNKEIMKQLDNATDSSNLDMIKLILERLTQIEDKMNYNSRKAIAERNNFYSLIIDSEDLSKHDINVICSSIETKLSVLGATSIATPIYNSKSIRVRIFNATLPIKEINELIFDLLHELYGINSGTIKLE